MKSSNKAPSRGPYQSSHPLKAIKSPPVEPSSKVGLLDNRSAITKRLSNEEVEERKKIGMCFHCDEKYTFDHKCKKIFNIEGYEEGLPDADQLPDHENLKHFPQVSKCS